MKVGLLFPMSTVYPGIGVEFIDGLNALLKQQQQFNNITLIKEGIGFGGIEKDVYLKAEQLLIRDDVDVLIAYVDEKVVSVLYPLIQATGKLMLVVNPGANYPVNWITQPTVIHLSLQHAFLSWLTGVWAATSASGNAALATTYYDCGYLHGAAMVNHFLETGGNIQYNYINNQKAYDESFDIQQLTQFLSAQPDCDNVLCVFDELPASLLYKLLNQYSAGRPLHLFVSPMMLQAKAMANVTTQSAYSINGYLPWYPEVETESNQLFVKSCTRPATIFSLLGWETAMILVEILQQNNIDSSNGDAAVSYLKTRTLTSPRGALQLDTETQFYVAPTAKYILTPGSAVPQIEWMANPEKEWKLFTATPTEGAVTGWTNTYLCY